MQIKAATRAGTLLTAFVEWWWTELTSLLPKTGTLQSLQQQARVQVTIDQDGLQLPAQDQAARVRGRFATLLYPKTAATVLVADKLVLSKTITLPKALLAQADRAVRYQLEQHMPLDLEKIYVGYRVHDVLPMSDMVGVDIAAVRKSKIDGPLDQLDITGLSPDVVSNRNGDIVLRVDRYDTVRQNRRSAIALLTLLAIVLFMAIPAVREGRIAAASADLQEQLNGLIARTKQATEIRRALDMRLSQLSFLAERQQSDIFASVFNLISDLTPDDISLTEIQYDGKTIRLNGVGRQLADWSLKLQEQAAFEDVRLENVTAEPNTGLERFQLSAVIRKPAGATTAPGAK